MVRAVPSISRIAWISDWRAPTRSSRCAVRNWSRFTSSACSSTARAFTGPIASSASVMRADFGLERLQVEVEQRGAFHQLIEGAVPLGLDPLDDAPAGAGGLGEPDLEHVALLVARLQRRARLDHLALRRGERRLGARASAASASALALSSRCSAISRSARASRHSPCWRISDGLVGVELGQLARQRLARRLRLGAHRLGARQPLLGRSQPAGDVRLLHLPVDPLLPGRLLLALQLRQHAPGRSPRSWSSRPRAQLALDQRGVDLGHPLLRSGRGAR